jgi:hypothetical protein
LPIHFVGEGEGLVFYAMPFPRGPTVAEAAPDRGAAQGVDRTLAIVEPILEALHQAHEARAGAPRPQAGEHRDRAGTGPAALVDFGIVKNLESRRDITETGYIVGTPRCT